MDDLNLTPNPSRGPPRPPTFSSNGIPRGLNGTLRRPLGPRNSMPLEARRRRSSALMSGERGGAESSPDPIQAKRRKMEPEYVQSEIGPIELKLLSCDGGKYRTSTAKPSSVLHQNGEVYCTEGSICNMVFEQVDDKCFTLERMVIQGPASGYTSPVQEGYIFVTMDDSDFPTCYNYPFASTASTDDEDDEDDDWAEPEVSEDDLDYQVETPLIEPCDNSPSTNTESPPNNAQTGSTQSRPRQLEPAARFKIHRDMNGNNMKATLTFEPALTGRYILARFFSPTKKKNIDIQFIGAYGYVGRRFFPSRTPR